MDTTYIGRRITELRQKNNISEYQLSLELGKGKSYIQTIVSGKSLPSVKQLYNICDYFNLSLAEFFDESNRDPIAIRNINSSAKELQPNDLKLLETLADRLAKGYDIG